MLRRTGRFSGGFDSIIPAWDMILRFEDFQYRFLRGFNA